MVLHDCFSADNRFSVIDCQHEQSAAIAAEAYAKSHPCGFGVVLVTTGPGLTNAVTGLVSASIDSVPVLCISGQVKSSNLVSVAHRRQLGVQHVHTDLLTKTYIKDLQRVAINTCLSQQLHILINTMKQARPGPVILEVPLDLQRQQFTYLPKDSISKIPCPEGPSLGNHELNHVTYLIHTAKRPLILVGQGCARSGLRQSDIVSFAEQFGIPVMTSWGSLDLFPFLHDLYAGRPGVVGLRYSNILIQSADLIIAIGNGLDDITTAYNKQNFGKFAKKVIVDVDPAELEHHQLHMDSPFCICADASHFILSLISFSKGIKYFEPLPDYTAWVEKLNHLKHLYGSENEDQKLHEARISSSKFTLRLEHHLRPSTHIITGSSGHCIENFYIHYKQKEFQRVFHSPGLGSMGYALPYLVGVMSSGLGHSYLCIEGDGSLQLNIQELATISSLPGSVILCIMENHGYQSIRNSQRTSFSGRLFASDTRNMSSTRFPDLSILAPAYGFRYVCIRTLHDLDTLFSSIDLDDTSKNYKIIASIKIEVEEILAPKCVPYIHADGSIISMPLEDMSPLLGALELESLLGSPLTQQSLSARASIV